MIFRGKHAIACSLLIGFVLSTCSALIAKHTALAMSASEHSPSSNSTELKSENQMAAQRQSSVEIFLRDGTISPATDGFWRRRISENVRYQPANLDAAGALFDLNYNVITNNSDPLTDVYAPASWTRRVGGTQWLDRVRFPPNFVLADAALNNTPNNPLCTANRDTKQYQCFNSFTRPTAGTPIYAYRSGSHGGSGLSGGDITGAALRQRRIDHAIGILVWAHRYLSYQNGGFTAPAERADGYASTGYLGTNGDLVMGSRLALRPGATAKSLGVSCRNLLPVIQALKQYGAYVVDDSGWDVFYVSTDARAAEMLKPCRDDLLKVYRALQIVTPSN